MSRMKRAQKFIGKKINYKGNFPLLILDVVVHDRAHVAFSSYAGVARNKDKILAFKAQYIGRETGELIFDNGKPRVGHFAAGGRYRLHEEIKK